MSDPAEGPSYEDYEYVLKIIKDLPEDRGSHVLYVYCEWVRSAAFAKGILEYLKTAKENE